jgi:hypothetical protein
MLRCMREGPMLNLPLERRGTRRSGTGSLAAFVWLFCATGAAWSQSSEPLSFTKDVLPILEQRCLVCHGELQRQSELDLRTREAMLKGGVNGPALTPGDARESRLYRRIAGIEAPVMPMGGEMPEQEILTLRDWINQGAPVEGASGQAAAPQEQKAEDWWAFQKPVRPAVPAAPAAPAAENARWSKNPIDAFAYRKLQEKGLKPAPRADKTTLLRRAYLDLLGLLPSPEQVDAFVNDNAPDAFARLVDGLLESPHYGERWGRHWLDVARYADSGGYEHDFDYPAAWRYRDYVVRAFNQDKPYDQFLREQLAGDELDQVTFETLTATGFHRVGPTVGYREKDNPQYRYNYLDDMIGTTSRVFMGLTVNCARCHDHKFDPITQVDYYRMMAVFFPYVNYDWPLAPPEEVAAYEAKKAAIEARIQPLRDRIAEIQDPYKEIAFEEKLKEFPEEIQVAVHTPEEQRSEGQKLLAAQVVTLRGGGIDKLMTEEHRAEVKKLEAEIDAIEKEKPKAPPFAMGIRDGDYRFTPDGRGDEPLPGKGERISYDFEGTFLPVAGQALRAAAGEDPAVGGLSRPGRCGRAGFFERAVARQSADGNSVSRRACHHREAACAGGVAHFAGPSAGGARDGQPRLAEPFRARHRRYAEQLRKNGAASHAPRAARLAGDRVHPPGLERQGDAPADDEFGKLSDELGVFRRGQRQERPAQRLLVALPAAAAGGRNYPRHDPGGGRQPQPRNGRRTVLPADSQGSAGVVPQRQVDGERRRAGGVAQERLFVFQARPAVSDVRRVRLAEPERHLREPRNDDGADAGADAAQ